LSRGLQKVYCLAHKTVPKKIYDINPPKGVKKTRKTTKPSKVKLSVVKQKEPIIYEEPVSYREPISRRESPKNERSVRQPILVGVAVIVLIAGVYLFFKLPKASITIWPKVEVLSFAQTITADKSVDVVNSSNNTIPAKYFEVVKTNSEDFPATGNASNEGRAKGTIVIFNKSDPVKSLTFKEGTHFMSDSGKLFVTYQKVVVPAGKKSGSKITPGSVQINVEAVEGGSDYNIAPSNFSVPGLKGTSYYYSVYATSSADMSGGYAGKVKKVTADDIQSAKDTLTQKTKLDAVSDLRNEIPADYIVLDSAIFSEVTNASTKVETGTVVDNFNYQVAVKASTLAFKKADIDEFAKKYITAQTAEGKSLVDNPEITYSTGLVDVSGGKATINLDFGASVYSSIDKNAISRSLLGKNTSQIEQTLNSSMGEDLSKVDIKFWPFWVKSTPKNQKAVNIEIKFQ